MASLLHVSRFLGKNRAKANKRAPSLASLSSLEGDKGKRNNVAATTFSNIPPSYPPSAANVHLKSESGAESVSDKGTHSFYATPPRSNVQSQAGSDGEREEAVEEAGYTVVRQAEDRSHDTEWTQLDLGNHSQEQFMKGKPPNNDVVHETRAQADLQLHLAAKQHEEELQLMADERDMAKKHAQDADDALHRAQADLSFKSGAIDTLQMTIKRLQSEVEDLKRQKGEMQDGAERLEKDLTDEVGRLKGIIAIERSENNERVENLNSEVVELNEKLEAQEDRIDRLETKVAHDEEVSRDVQAMNYDLELRLERCEDEIAQEKSRLEEKDSHVAMLEMNNKHMASELVRLQDAANASERQNRMLMDQLRQQSTEFQTSKGLNRPNSQVARIGRGFQGTANPARIESAIRTARILNEEIYQAAASMTDQLENIAKRFVVEDGGRFAVAENLKSMLGTELVRSLQKQAQDPVEEYKLAIIQVALQGSLIACCMRIITSWYPNEWEYGDFLVALYERIRGTFGAEAALEWRKTALKSCAHPAELTKKLTGYLAKEVEGVLAVCGWSKLSGVDGMMNAFQLKLKEIATLAIRLNGLTSAGVVGELEGTLIESGKIFDSEQMENNDPSESKSARRPKTNLLPNEQIICTVALGLKRTEAKDVGADQIILKPKVVLYGSLW